MLVNQSIYKTMKSISLQRIYIYIYILNWLIQMIISEVHMCRSWTRSLFIKS